jgi:UDP:flavonoid glycosyltransferase YjiC (YdhE family)
MRILFTTTAGMGHFHPLVPLAQAAARAGHTVAFACPQSLCQNVEASGFQAFPVLDDRSADPESMATMERIQQAPSPTASNNLMVADMFIGIRARRTLPELVALCQRWQPDIIVREELEFAGAIAAEHLGLPHAAVQVTYAYNGQTLEAFFPRMRQRLNELREAWALPADSGLTMLYRYLLLSFDPPTLLDPALVRSSTTHHLRAEVFDRSSAETLPSWLTQEQARPLIYVTLGTEAPKIPSIFPAAYQSILAGLHDESGTVVLTIGRERDPAELGPQPAHVHVERYIPQSLLLPHCDLVVTHGGHNTVLAALQFGLPLVVVPFFADQFDNAARCAALEVGRTIVGSELTPEIVRDTVHAVLHDERYRRNAMRLQREMQALPSLTHGVRLLEQLAVERMPIVSGASLKGRATVSDQYGLVAALQRH